MFILLLPLALATPRHFATLSTFEEMVSDAAAEARLKAPTPKQVRRIFNAYDRDNDDRLTQRELDALLAQSWTPRMINENQELMKATQRIRRAHEVSPLRVR